jgi:hypothetical protein
MAAGSWHLADLSEAQGKLLAVMNEHQQEEVPVAFVFANGNKKFVKECISPLVQQWNFRSNKWIHILFIGYIVAPKADNGFSPVAPNQERFFDEKTFVEYMETIEKASGWKYAGGTVLLLCRGYIAYNRPYDRRTAEFDYSHVVEFNLEAIDSAQAAGSVESLFETLITVAKETPGGNISREFSRKVGATSLGRAAIEQLDSRFKGLKNAIRGIRLLLKAA